MVEENINQEFRFKNINETNYFVEEMEQNELTSIHTQAMYAPKSLYNFKLY